MKNRFVTGANLLIADPPYLLAFTPQTPGDFLLFPKVKGQLAGLSFAQESLNPHLRGHAHIWVTLIEA